MNFTFSKKERLCSRKQIQQLFSSKETVTSFPFRILYRLVPADDEVRVQVLFSVPKKLFKRAVKRNLIRRRAKEAFRLNKHLLYEFIPKNHKLHLMFIYFDEKIQSYNSIKKGVSKGIEKMGKYFNETF